MAEIESNSLQPRLYVVDPDEGTDSHQYNVLTEELKRNRINFNTLMGFEEAKQIMGQRDTDNMMVIVNSNIADASLIPKELFSYKNNKIYYFPKDFKDKNCPGLPNTEKVIRTYQGMLTKRNGPSPDKKIRLKSIKKEFLKNSDGRPKESYDKIMIINPKTSDREYLALFNALKNDFKHVETVTGQN